MGAEDGFAAVVDHTVDGRQRGSYAGVVRNLQRIVKGDVEIRADDDPLAREGEVVDRLTVIGTLLIVIGVVLTI